MHTNLFFGLTRSILKYFNNSYKIVLRRNSYCNTISQAVFVYKLRDAHGTPTSKTEPLRIVSNVQLVKGLLLQIERQIQHCLGLLRQ